MRKNKKQGPTIRVFLMLWKFSKMSFISYAFFQLFSSVVPFFNLWISAELITALYERREQSQIWLLVFVTLIANLIFRILSALFEFFVRKADRNMKNHEKEAFNDKVLSLDYDKLENPELRNLRRKIVTNSWINYYGTRNMIENIKNLISVIVKLVFSTVLFAEMLMSIVKAGFSLLSVILLAGMLLSLTFGIIWSVVINKKQAVQWKKSGDILLKGNRMGGAYPKCSKDIRIFSMLPYIKRTNAKYSKEYRKVMLALSLKMAKYIVPSVFMSKLLEYFSYLLVFVYCGMGVFPIGGVIKYVGYLGGFSDSIQALFRCIAQFSENRPFLETYLEFFDIENSMYQGSLSIEKRSDKRYEIELRNVSFKYPDSKDYVLKNINLKLKVGERIAVVGMNGSGKTTLIKLLCRLYDPTEGEIIMNDFNIRKFNYHRYLELFSVVFQDYKLLSFTLGQNVAASSEYDAKRAEECLREVGFSERYDTLQKKLDTPLYKNFDKEGVEISGGEAQKIVLARAIYKDAPFIILDEPTAALDPLAEAEIYQRFNEIVGDKTAVYISHRLASCRFCDKILVLDRGEIVQLGTHEELLAEANGKYFELWHAQAQYYT